MSERVFRFNYRVCYADCTVGNHVYYSRYLNILEIARGEFFRHLGKTLLQLQSEDIAFPVLECRLKYHAPARYDDLLTIEIRVAMARGVRLNFSYRFLSETSRLLVEGETFHACTSTSEKPRKIPEYVLSSLGPFLADPPHGS